MPQPRHHRRARNLSTRQKQIAQLISLEIQRLQNALDDGDEFTVLDIDPTSDIERVRAGAQQLLTEFHRQRLQDCGLDHEPGPWLEAIRTIRRKIENALAKLEQRHQEGQLEQYVQTCRAERAPLTKA